MIVRSMSKLLDQAVEVVRRLDPATQDDIARVMKILAGDDEGDVVRLSQDERAAIAKSKAEIAQGNFATDEQVQALWAKYGL